MQAQRVGLAATPPAQYAPIGHVVTAAPAQYEPGGAAHGVVVGEGVRVGVPVDVGDVVVVSVGDGVCELVALNGEHVGVGERDGVAVDVGERVSDGV